MMISCSKSRSRTKQRRVIPHIPEEILIVILLKLPVKSLIRFRCVSKSLCSIINHPTFVAEYLKFNHARSNNNNRLMLVRYNSNLDLKTHILLHYTNSQSTVELEPPIEALRNIVGSCNGLVGLSYTPNRNETKTQVSFSAFTEGYVIWNPCIKEHVILPIPTIVNEYQVVCVKGFGYDPNTDDYKVLRLLQPHQQFGITHRSMPPQAELYSHRNGSWKTLTTDDALPHPIICYRSQVVMNNVLHWPVSAQVCTPGGYYNFILSFDPANEVFQEIKLPQDLVCVCSLCLSLDVNADNSRLSAFYHLDSPGWYLYMWTMEQYGVPTSWTKLFIIDLSLELPGVIGKPYGFSKNDSLVLFKTHGKTLISYDPESKHTEDLKALPDHLSSPTHLNVTTYIESLVSPTVRAV